MRHVMKSAMVLAAMVASGASLSQAAPTWPYQFGFEDNKQPAAYDPTFGGTDWFVMEFDDPAGSAVVASGGGSLGLTTPEGSRHLELKELNDGWFGGYSSSAVIRQPGTRTGVYYGDWFQALKMYIDPAWASPANPGDIAIGITMGPNQVGAGYFTERLISLRVPGNGTVEVQFNQTTYATITQAGWYNLAVDFYRSGNLTTDPFLVNYWVTDEDDYLVASLIGTASAGWGGGPFPSSDLGDPRYGWILGQNDFPSNRGGLVGIDDIRYDVGSYEQYVLIPEPASLSLLALSSLAMLRRRR